MAHPFGDTTVFQQRLDERGFGRRDDRGQTHRFPPWQHRQQCGGRQGGQGDEQRDPDDQQPQRHRSVQPDAVESEFRGLIEQDDRQRQLR